VQLAVTGEPGTWKDEPGESALATWEKRLSVAMHAVSLSGVACKMRCVLARMGHRQASKIGTDPAPSAGDTMESIPCKHYPTAATIKGTIIIVQYAYLEINAAALPHPKCEIQY
jgi:hypothetical protein